MRCEGLLYGAPAHNYPHASEVDCWACNYGWPSSDRDASDEDVLVNLESVLFPCICCQHAVDSCLHNQVKGCLAS
jgi:hypothetical protein